jgi:hypothetical protein
VAQAKGIKEVAYVDVKQGGTALSLGSKRSIGPVSWTDCAGGGQVVVQNGIAYIGNMRNPQGTLIVDVKDPKKPKIISQLSMPPGTHSHKVRVSGDIMITNREALGQHALHGEVPPDGYTGGLSIYDISKPEAPKLITNWDATDPAGARYARGVHRFDFDGRYAYISPTMEGYVGNIMVILDLKDPSKPEEVGRWWYPGQREGDSEPPMPRHPKFDGGYRPHNMTIYPERPDRAYLGYIDGGAVILDISDKAHPKEITKFRYSPPMNGMTHTVMPLLERDLLVISDECNKDEGVDWPKLVWIVNAADEKNLVPIATLPLPDVEAFGKRGGRFGAHNLHENYPLKQSWRSDQIVLGAFFNAGVRAYDISNPYQPREIAYFVPGAPKLSPKGAIQINDVYVDDRRLVYAVDRFSGGLYILEMNV